MADVEVVATYDLYNVNRIKLENLIHRVFDLRAAGYRNQGPFRQSGQAA